MATFELLYPERRHVSVEWVLTQGFDAKVNAAVDAHVRQHGPFADADGAYEAFVAGIAAPDLQESIALLEDLGLATFARATWIDRDGTAHGPEDVDPDYYCQCGTPWVDHARPDGPLVVEDEEE